MRGKSPGGAWGGTVPRVVWFFLWTTVAVFLLQKLLHVGLAESGMPKGGLSRELLAQGHVYLVLTTLFVHNSIGQVIVNLLCLYFIGKEVARQTGPTQFTLLYLIGGMVGALLELTMSLMTGSTMPIYGASGAISALLGAFAIMQPNALAGIPPFLTFRVINLAWTWVILNVIFGLITLSSPDLGMNSFACAAGTLYGFLHGRSFLMGAAHQPHVRKPSAAKTASYSRRKDTPNVIDAEFTDKKPDYNAVLDKINKEGMGALTPQERKILEQASEALNKGKRQ